MLIKKDYIFLNYQEFLIFDYKKIILMNHFQILDLLIEELDFLNVLKYY